MSKRKKIKGLTIAQIIGASWREVMRLLPRRYIVTDTIEIPPEFPDSPIAYYVFIKDPVTDLKVPCTWVRSDDEANDELGRINLVKSLLVNGAECLDWQIEDQEKERRKKRQNSNE